MSTNVLDRLEEQSAETELLHTSGFAAVAARPTDLTIVARGDDDDDDDADEDELDDDGVEELDDDFPKHGDDEDFEDDDLDDDE